MMEWVAEQPARTKAPSTNAPSRAPNRIPACGMGRASPECDPGRRAGGSLSMIHDGKRLRHDSRNRTRPPIAGRIRLFSGQENGTAEHVVKEALRLAGRPATRHFSQLLSETIAMALFRIG